MTDRHRFRAQWHDYNDGIYFVTICSHEKRHVFGHIRNGNYHEHIIRDQRAFDNIMNYVDNNVRGWAADCFNK